ncbi:hypothetical protein J6590_028223 [Homalodisca vitripennis]|nr:hypothetical protein J6590_028223 [Homalodisca vitripennis]
MLQDMGLLSLDWDGFAVCLLAVGVYVNTLGHGFVYDDKGHFWLVYTFQLNPQMGTAKTDVSIKSGQPYGRPGAAHH